MAAVPGRGLVLLQQGELRHALRHHAEADELQGVARDQSGNGDPVVTAGGEPPLVERQHGIHPVLLK